MIISHIQGINIMKGCGNMNECYAVNLIKVAKKYVGYLEKESNKDLEKFKANAGDENYTIFAKRYFKITGENLQGQPWCDMFVDTSFVEAFGKSKAKELLIGFDAYTPDSAQYFKNKKQWYTSNPKPGDIIFYKNSKRICHTGIVDHADGTYVYTIEGNTSAGGEVIPNGGAVCEKKFLLTNPRIAGYGRPKYDVPTAVKQPVKPVATKPATTKSTPVYHVVSKGDNLTKIALAYKTTVDTLVKLNNLKNKDIINLGQKLRVK
jgi:LysM repeat protein